MHVVCMLVNVTHLDCQIVPQLRPSIRHRVREIEPMLLRLHLRPSPRRRHLRWRWCWCCYERPFTPSEW